MKNPVLALIKSFTGQAAALCACALALAALIPSAANAQQLYISHIGVYYSNAFAGAGTDQYCTATTPAIDVSRGSATWNASYPNPVQTAALIEFDQPNLHTTYPGACLSMCATLQCVNTLVGTQVPGPFGVDEMNFQIFKYSTSGVNPNDPSSAPPLRTIALQEIGTCPVTSSAAGTSCPTTTSSNCFSTTTGAFQIGVFCAGWDGYYNVDTTFGKTNGTFGFRAEAKTNETLSAGNIVIDQTASYPGENQYPISVDVTDVHSVASTPTVVGNITSVGAEPYNIKYRLSKDSTVDITISTASTTGTTGVIRTLLKGADRFGEGLTSLTNGDSWDGRDDSGVLVSSGNYLATITAYSSDEWGQDISIGVTSQISLEPLLMTDFKVKALGPSATDIANISYFLTESATVYLRIYSPSTTFSSLTGFTACSGSDTASCGPTATGTLVQSTATLQFMRTSVTNTWDGRDASGNAVADGDYPYMIWAEMPGRLLNGSIGTITTPKAYQGMMTIARGDPMMYTAPNVSATIIGSSPSVAALPPFYFTVGFVRPVTYDFNIKTTTNAFVRHLYTGVSAQANNVIAMNWDGADDNGYYVSSGTFMAELVASDPLFPKKTYRYTTTFSANLFRVTDVVTAPLLTSSSGTISYLPSQTMNIDLRVYPPGTAINTGSATWPPTISTTPVTTFTGVRPGKYKATEYWDGYDTSNNMVADGQYPTLVTMYSSAPVVNYDPVANTVTTLTSYYVTDRAVVNLTVARGPVYIGNVSITPTVPSLINSTQSVQLPPYEIAFNTTRISSVTIQALSLSSSECGGNGKVCRTITTNGNNIFTGGTNQFVYWDGKDDKGVYLPSDAYNIQIVAYNYPGVSLQQATTYQDTLYVNNFQVYDMAISDLTLKTGQAALAYQISVPMKVAVQVFKPGTTFDTSGNPTPAIASGSLVKVIGGVRPQLSPVSEIWDGTDRSGRTVPDGTYIFRIVTSTDSALLNSDTGEVVNNNINYVADKNAYLFPMTVSVSHGDSSDPCGDLDAQALFYPNPLRQSRGCFNIGYAPVTGYYSVKLYNVAGDLVSTHDWGSQGNQLKLTWDWDRTNDSGKKIARGVYFAVFKLQATGGGKQICQTIKKILIPSNADGTTVSQGCY